jgi:hypothetical protein
MIALIVFTGSSQPVFALLYGNCTRTKEFFDTAEINRCFIASLLSFLFVKALRQLRQIC